MSKSQYEPPHDDAIADARLYARLQREAWAREEAAMLAAAATREDVLRREAMAQKMVRP